MCTSGTTQKRGPGGRRNRKQSAISELTVDGSHEKSFVWWQGGKQSKLVFQKAILPLSMIKRAARAGNFFIRFLLFRQNESVSCWPLKIAKLSLA